MQSHRFHASTKDVFAVIAPPLAALVFWTVCLRTANWIGALPPARLELNPDNTVLSYKSQAARSKHSARIVLIGDSSCLTGVDALQLEESLPRHPQVFNLGLILGLSWETYADTLGDFVQTNANQVQAAVLLVTPQKLKDEDDNPYFEARWRRLRDGVGGQSMEPELKSVRRLLGANVFQEHLLSRALAAPLKGTSARFYGFSSGIWEYLDSHRGSIMELGTFSGRARAEKLEYFISATLEQKSRRFRAALPPGTKLVAGIMPVPETLVDREYGQKHQALMGQWNRWLKADQILTNLPATLPNGLFATGAHLNERGQRYFTKLVARELARQELP